MDENENRTSKSAELSTIRLAQITSNHDTNLYGTVHGGVMMKFIDDAAAATAARHSEAQAVTVSVDRLRFHAPVRVGDLVTATSVLTSVGRTSMHIEVTVTAADSHKAEAEHTVATALLTFVAVDAAGKPQLVPLLD